MSFLPADAVRPILPACASLDDQLWQSLGEHQAVALRDLGVGGEPVARLGLSTCLSALMSSSGSHLVDVKLSLCVNWGLAVLTLVDMRVLRP